MKLGRTMAFFLAGILLVSNFAFAPAFQKDAQEYILKAAFLYRFADYVEGNSNNSEDTFNIAVLGNSGIIPPLNEIANGKRIRNKKIFIRPIDNINDLGSCQMLFISRNYGSLEPVIAKLDNRPLLIITEQNGGCEKGAHINFLTAENKLKFEVNLRTARRAGLKISSQLLQHAYIYKY